MVTYAPVFWTNKGTKILTVFNFSDDSSTSTFYEFDTSTLETVGAPFEGHTHVIYGLALSSDGTLIASASGDDTIKLWAFESRQLLASFHVSNPNIVVFSPDVQQLAYTTYGEDNNNIYICNVPPNILASIGLATKGHPKVRLYPPLLSFGLITFSRRPVQPLRIYWMYASCLFSHLCWLTFNIAVGRSQSSSSSP
jgi:WD40 repeat protein